MSARPDMAGRIVSYGEILLRVAAPPGRTPPQTAAPDACAAGAADSVAVSLALLGHRAALVGALPDNALGRAALDTLRTHGVDTYGIRLHPGRMGLYFIAPRGAIIHDRAGSAFALADPALYDWPALLDGAAFLHLAGDVPARGMRAALRAAHAAGVRIAFDAAAHDGTGALPEALRMAHVLFAAPPDVALALGRPDLADPARGAEAARAAFAAFPQLELLAWTDRVQHGADVQALTAVLHTRTAAVSGGSYRLAGVVDRVGTGAAFAAGVLHGLQAGMAPADVAGFALAAAAMKHAIAGDVVPVHAGACDAPR